MSGGSIVKDQAKSWSDATRECPVDPIPRWTAFARSLRPLRVIADKSMRRTYTHQEFLDASALVCREAAHSSLIGDKSAGLWQMEKLGFSYCRHARGTLNTSDIPIEIQPISHVGLGIAATETAGFSSDRVSELIDSRAHPDFREFPYESIGCIWAVYANKIYRWMFRTISKANIPVTKLPPWAEFASQFSPEIQRLLNHGYGRTLYFKNCSVRRAIREAGRVEGVNVAAAAQGIAFAYAMLNHSDLHQVLETGRDIKNEEIAEGFRKGLTYALAFWEWPFPGFLDSLNARTDRQSSFISTAKDLTDRCRLTKRFVGFGTD
ncbi:MAG: hypothetical protein ACI8T1_002480 [Verrucomicrobiales bacterium]|jgi:hypothetical protein